MTNQDIENFRIASKRTMASLGNDKLDLCHCLLGMMSELEEYQEAIINKDVVGCGEELCDEFFYIVNYMTFRNIELQDLKFDYNIYYNQYKIADNKTIYNLLVIHVSKLSDLVKKYIAYNKEIDKEKEYNLVIKSINTLYLLYKTHNIDPVKAMQNNIDKLLVRFPLAEGFTTKKANSRNLVEERKMLEQ